MALLYDQSSEIKVLKTILDDRINEHVRSSLLGQLKKEHFHDAACSAAFQRLSFIAQKRFELLTAQELFADPVIDDDLRAMLRQNMKKVKVLRNKKTRTAGLRVLDQYRKLRSIYDAANSILTQMESSEVDVDSMLAELSETVSKANSGMNSEQFYLTFGKGDTSKSTVDRILLNEKSVRIPTGFQAYDSENSGVPEKGVMILAATTSGGKSAVAMNLCSNWYLKQNKSVMRISLEMDDIQETRRLASHLSKVEFSKFVHGRLNTQDKQLVKRTFEEFSAHGVKHEISYNSISPQTGMSIDDVFSAVSPYAYDIIAIDYIGLLAGMDASSQWFQLSEVTAKAKRFSNAHNCLVVLLAQLDDTSDKLRYARGIKEHADTMWQWNYTKQEQRDLHILPVHVSKDRDGKVFNFELAERFNVMTAEDMEGGSGDYSAPTYDEEEEDVDLTKRQKSKKKKRRRISEDEDSESSETYALN